MLAPAWDGCGAWVEGRAEQGRADLCWWQLESFGGFADWCLAGRSRCGSYVCLLTFCGLLLSSAMSTLAWLYELSEPASRNVLDGSVRRCGAVDLSDDHRHLPVDIWYMYYSAGKLCDFCAGYVHMHNGY
jgi:hypothetical protein